jgi:hypothetical protein
MCERIPCALERPALSQSQPAPQLPPRQLNPAQPPTGGGIAAATRWPSKPPASASAKAPVPATPTIMVSAGRRAEGQPAGGGVDHARRQDW